jgi:hypothetical protein
MGEKSFSDVMSGANVMVSGLFANLPQLENRGMNQAFVDDLSTRLTRLKSLDAEQESLKAQLKTKSAALDAELKGLRDKIAEAKKVVKLAADKTTWKAYGISDSK